MRARDNPFASHRIEALPFFFPEGDTWASFLTRLAAQRWRGSVVGLHGSGKTTLLEQLRPHLISQGFAPHLLVLRAESTAKEKRDLLAKVKELRAPDFLLLDGAEQLSSREWLAVESAAGPCAGCLITLHKASRLPVVLETEPSPALLQVLVHQLCTAWLPDGEAPAMFERHGGNLRECLRELYDRWAG